MMSRSTLLTLITIIHTSIFAQSPISDKEGLAQIAPLKKLNKKADYGAFLIEKEFNFGIAKGFNDEPIVSARQHTAIQMVSLENNSQVGYIIPFNQFMQISDYDFQLFQRKGFKTQKYSPVQVSLTDDEVFLDDNFGQFYGFIAPEAGTRCRFKYDYSYQDAKYLSRIFFNEVMPIGKYIVQFKVPSWLELDITEKNFGKDVNIRKTMQEEKDYNIYTYTAENLKSIKPEPSSLSIPFYLPHLIITVRSYTVEGKKYKGFQSVADVYSWYNFLYKKAVNDPSVLKSTTQDLIKAKTSDEEKIKSIYYWVQDNIRYIAFEEGYSAFIPQTAQEVFKNRYGDCKGMANLLTEMLKLSGYDAHFAWVGTREIPYDRAEVQSLCVDNHAICVLYLDGKTYFLDGTEKFAPLGKNAYRIQGKTVLVQDEDTFRMEKVPPASMEDNLVSTNVTLELKKDKITGHVVRRFVGESKNFFLNLYNGIPADMRKKLITRLLEMEGSNTEASKIETSDFSNRDIPIELKGDIEITNTVTSADNLIYTHIDFFPSAILNFIPDEERQTPFDLGRVFISIDEITLELPPGTGVKKLPEAFNFTFQENTIQANYHYENNKVVLLKKLELNSPVIYPQDFAKWKGFLTQIKTYNRNSITLVKE